jgi:hypothetical protein
VESGFPAITETLRGRDYFLMTLNNGNINSQSVTKRAGLVAMVAVTLTIGAAAISVGTVATLTAPTALADPATGATSCGGNQSPIYDKDGKFVGCGTINPRPQTPVFKTGRFVNRLSDSEPC